VKAKGYEVANRFSEAYSGLSLERPELDNLRELVRDEIVDVIVCYSLDRLSRDPGPWRYNHPGIGKTQW